MKKIVLLLMLLPACLLAVSQNDSLQEYTGKYRFPDGSPVTEIGVVLEDGVLTATSVMGNSEFRKTDSKDVFEIVAFAGTATFKRNGDGKIIGLRIQVQDIDMEGTREEGGFSQTYLQELFNNGNLQYCLR